MPRNSRIAPVVSNLPSNEPSGDLTCVDAASAGAVHTAAMPSTSAEQSAFRSRDCGRRIENNLSLSMICLPPVCAFFLARAFDTSRHELAEIFMRAFLAPLDCNAGEPTKRRQQNP